LILNIHHNLIYPTCWRRDWEHAAWQMCSTAKWTQCQTKKDNQECNQWCMFGL